MTTVAKADKSRLTIRGLVDGRHYIVHEQPGGWFITPEKEHRVKRAGMSADAFARLYGSRSPLGAETARESRMIRLRQANGGTGDTETRSTETGGIETSGRNKG
jgi:hypothetical protein